MKGPLTARREDRSRSSVSRLVSLALALIFMVGGLWQPGAVFAAGTVSLTALDVAYTQDFNTLASSGTGNTTVPTGWEFSESGGNANTNYRAGTGSDTNGDTYSFGASSNSERAFGGLRSGTLIPLIGAQFTNDTGSPITSLDIAYTGEQWRLGQNPTGRPADRLDFQVSLNATSLTTGTWIDYNALDFSSPVVAGTVGAINGNAASNRTALTYTITELNIPSGATFWLRWSDSDLNPGADDGLSVDDFSLTPHTSTITPRLSINDISLVEGSSGTTSFNFTVSLSAPAGAGGVTFDIATADGAAPSGATAGSDYTAKSLTGQSIAAGNSSYTFSVLVSGDTAFESSETFFVNVTNVTGAEVVDAQGLGTIIDDDLCGSPSIIKISAVQGSGSNSPLTGSVVAVEGIVVGDYQASGQFGGYYIQEENADADADPATSEGIFIYNDLKAVSVGDKVFVRGTVKEFLSSGQPLTELVDVANTSVQVCSSGNALPTAASIDLPVAVVEDFERYEGMLVNIPETLTVTETYTLGRFGEVMLSANGRLFTPTNIAAPGAPAAAVQDLNNRSSLVLDDGSNQQNIDTTIYPTGGLSASNTLRSGYTVNGITGVLEQRFGIYRLQPVGAVDFQPTNPRSAAPQPVSGTVKVASFNVLNYFNGNGTGGGFPTARGATSADEFARQRAKTVSAITTLDADIVGLMELENDPTGSSAIEDLVSGLNDATAPGTYAFIDTGVIGTDEIRVALLYKPAVVTPFGAYALMTSAVDPRFIDTRNRPSLAQTFSLNANGARLTVVVNHLKSKGSACDDDPDLLDGQGNCNITRTQAALALADWLASDPTGAQDADYLLIGDMNSYALEDPITAFKNSGYTDLVSAFVGPQAYSYVFDGMAGYLDHALATGHLAAQVSGVTEWHINADEPTVLDYNIEYKSANQKVTFYAPDAYRSSDHDPVLVGFNLTNDPPTASAGGPYGPADEGSAALTLTASGADPDGTPVSFAWDLDNDGSFETPGQTAQFTPVDGTFDYPVAVQVTDATGLSSVAYATVSVNNVAPTLGAITAPLAPVKLGSPVAVSASFSDPGVLDTHAAQIDWGDGMVEPGAVSETSGAGSLSGSHVYAAPGVYVIGVTVTDKDGGSASAQFSYVVVYDPNGGFVTGGGWINSPAGAYLADPALAGKATFGFVAKYQKGANLPTGNTEFKFQAAGFTFTSTSYEWLVVAGSKAQYKGAGLVNGQPTADGAHVYKFMLSANDGSPDRLRMRVWWEDDSGAEQIVYDNGADSPLGGGSIVVHK